LNEIDIFEQQIRPKRPMTKEAMDINGYAEEKWVDALPYDIVIKKHSEFAKGGRFTAQNITFDWSFIDEAFNRENIKSTLDYHRLDLPSILWFINPDREKYSLSKVCKEFGIPDEPVPHRAINGARLLLNVLKYVRTTYKLK
jgi:DNA polymerase III alpha subunit (gram-positive type)